MPGIPQVGNGIASSSSGFVLRRRREGEPLGMVGVVGDPHAHAALVGVAQRARHDVARLARQPHVVEREVERLARLAEERGDPARHVERFAAGMERECLDHCCQRKPAGAMRGSSGLVGSPSGKLRVVVAGGRRVVRGVGVEERSQVLDVAAARTELGLAAAVGLYPLRARTSRTSRTDC